MVFICKWDGAFFIHFFEVPNLIISATISKNPNPKTGSVNSTAGTDIPWLKYFSTWLYNEFEASNTAKYLHIPPNDTMTIELIQYKKLAPSDINRLLKISEIAPTTIKYYRCIK